MIPNNNLSVLPWYTSKDQQNSQKWWVNGKVYPLFTPAGKILPFQLLINHVAGVTVSSFRVFTKDGVLVDDSGAILSRIEIIPFASLGYDVVVYGSLVSVFASMDNGQYYAEMVIGGQTWYSEIFTVVNDISGYLKLEWWDESDFVMDAGTIVYNYETEPGTAQFRNVIYLCSDIAKPEYTFEDETEERDGYSFPTKQISKKIYHFSFWASEYLLDVMRFIRMSDHVQITKDGQVYSADTFLISPEWESNGDIASVEAEFTTATVAKKIGVGYIRSMRGDFNDDFNNDFNNQ